MFCGKLQLKRKIGTVLYKKKQIDSLEELSRLPEIVFPIVSHAVFFSSRKVYTYVYTYVYQDNTETVVCYYGIFDRQDND